MAWHGDSLLSLPSPNWKEEEGKSLGRRKEDHLQQLLLPSSTAHTSFITCLSLLLPALLSLCGVDQDLLLILSLPTSHTCHCLLCCCMPLPPPLCPTHPYHHTRTHPTTPPLPPLNDDRGKGGKHLHCLHLHAMPLSEFPTSLPSGDSRSLPANEQPVWFGWFHLKHSPGLGTAHRITITVPAHSTIITRPDRPDQLTSTSLTASPQQALHTT